MNSTIKRAVIDSKVFKKYIGYCPLLSVRESTVKRADETTWKDLESFAVAFGFKVVDRYFTYDKDAGRHVPAIEVF